MSHTASDDVERIWRDLEGKEIGGDALSIAAAIDDQAIAREAMQPFCPAARCNARCNARTTTRAAARAATLHADEAMRAQPMRRRACLAYR